MELTNKSTEVPTTRTRLLPISAAELKKLLVAAGYPARALKAKDEYSSSLQVSKSHARMEYDVSDRLEKAGWKKIDTNVAVGGYSGSLELAKDGYHVTVSQFSSNPVSCIGRKEVTD